MGLFKRKEGGTRVGNLVRRLSLAILNEVTFGLGSSFADTNNDGQIDFW